MTADATVALPATKTESVSAAAGKAKERLTSRWASLAAIVLGLLWTLPTFGLALSSIRPEKQIKTSGWWTFFTDPQFTLDNYRSVLGAEGGINLGRSFFNSFIITLPAVIIPMVLAGLAAYAFAWVDFKGRNVMFVAVFALQIVPIQVTLIPLLKIFNYTGLSDTYWTVWLAHSCFALPLAIFLLHNFMKEIPRELIEAARMDGAGHVSIIFRVLLPLLTPALAAFGIFQFLWVWNDLLVALTFTSTPELAPLTVGIANLTGTRGTAYHLLTAGAFVSILVPVAVFLSLQRYFVRGLLAGGLKG